MAIGTFRNGTERNQLRGNQGETKLKKVDLIETSIHGRLIHQT